jgi:ribosomal protein S27E
MEEQTVWVSPRATSFTVVCDACTRVIAADGYGAATVYGELPLEVCRGTLECARGHRLRVEREGR